MRFRHFGRGFLEVDNAIRWDLACSANDQFGLKQERWDDLPTSGCGIGKIGLCVVLNAWAMNFTRAICGLWSSPTGTMVDLHSISDSGEKI
jgi:hypothetical protein